jgi:hypothetical protein
MQSPLFGRLASLAAAAALVLALTLAIVWPIWSLANGNRRAFTIAVAAALALALAFAIARAVRRRIAARSRRSAT